MAHLNNDSILPVTRTVAGLRARVGAWRSAGETVAFVPTMGALHRGHLSLVELGGKQADRTVASIFVNPTQFAAHEDLGSYPRTEAEDLEKLASAGCDLAFVPDAHEMYAPGYATSVRVDALSEGLCGASRPHFFGGVATVVTKLLNQCQPDIAIFGEKDYQQLLIIKRLVRDLDIPVNIIGGPLVREEDGLAMSSRNQYLSAEERQIAGRLNRVMRETIEAMLNNMPVSETLALASDNLKKAGFADIDYLEVRDGEQLSLLGPETLTKDEKDTARLFAAAMLGKTRLIDNMPLLQAAQ